MVEVRDEQHIMPEPYLKHWTRFSMSIDNDKFIPRHVSTHIPEQDIGNVNVNEMNI